MPGGGKVPIPPPQFHVEQHSASTICITTESLSLTYDSSVSGGDFTSASVGITLRNGSVDGTTWSPGTPDTGNLLGTRLDLTCYATFDECYSNGLGWGPLSRNGWALWDDTAGVRMEVTPNPQVGYPWYDSSVPCSHDGICSQTEKDWYFFGHGRQYRVALEDFSAVSGGAPLPPLAAFGVWWSTWYNFTAYELTTTVLEGYRKHGLPLDVVVMDMDVCITYVPNRTDLFDCPLSISCVDIVFALSGTQSRKSQTARRGVGLRGIGICFQILKAFKTFYMAAKTLSVTP